MSDLSAFRRAGNTEQRPARPVNRTSTDDTGPTEEPVPAPRRVSAGLAAAFEQAGPDADADAAMRSWVPDEPTPGPEAGPGPVDEPRAVYKIGARISETLYQTLRDYGDRHRLYFDQVLVEAMGRHGSVVVEKLAAERGAERPRKGERTDVTSFHLRAKDHELLEQLQSSIPKVSRSRLITGLLEAHFAGEPTKSIKAK